MTQSGLDVKRDEASRTIPLPERPGTVWSPNPGTVDGVYVGYAATYCTHCRKGYNSHGGVVDGRAAHLCPASDAAWAAYWDARRRANVGAFLAFLTDELDRLSESDRAEVLTGLRARYGD